MGNIQTVGPNEALIVSGGCCRPSRKQIIVGGWCWSTWMLTNIQRMSLQVMTLNPKCEHVQSIHGVPVTVTGVVHCKIMSSPEFLPLAAEQFLGKSTDNIKSVVLHTVEGHMRAVIGTQSVEDICKSRQTLANLIREATTKDLSRMGIDILSLTIKEIKDDVEYLSSAGKKSTAEVKKNAAIEVAKAESEAVQKETECQNEKKDQELKNKSELADLEHKHAMDRANRTQEVSKIEAEAQKAYDLQLALMQKSIREIELQVEELDFDKRIESNKEESTQKRIELEMEMEVDLPAQSEVYKLTKQTETNTAKLKLEVEAEEYKIKKRGEASAEATKLVGGAEAAGMKLLAEARQNFNQAAMLAETLKVLPEIAAEVSSPLTRFEEIVLISDKESTDKRQRATEASKLTSAIATSIKAVGGSDRMSAGLVNSMLRMTKT